MRWLAHAAVLVAGCGPSASEDDAPEPVVETEESDVPEDTDAPPADTFEPPADTDAPEVLGDVKLVPAGTFTMGSPRTEPLRRPDEAQVSVTLTRDLWMMRSEVTQGLYEEVTGANPSRFGDCGADCPVEQVSWYDAVAFANLLSARDGLTPVYTIAGTMVTADWDANGWRLPTEAEWERGARGGESFVYAGDDDVDAVAWHIGNAGDVTHPACTKAPNAYGLCDMSGNVFEWTWDGYGESLPGGEDPRGASSVSFLVARGGSWGSDRAVARVAARFRYTPDFASDRVGFRLARYAP